MSKYAQTIIRPVASFLTQQSLFFQTIQVIMGSIFLAIMAQVAFPLPFTPVPLTLQTLGIALLALAQGKNKAALSVLAYLAQATVGLPVLAGGLANPLWMIGPRAGYLIGFAVAAYTIGLLMERSSQKSWGWTFLSLSVGEFLILSLGSLWLAVFVGIESAFYLGFLPFIANAAIKVTMACTLEKSLDKVWKKMITFD